MKYVVTRVFIEVFAFLPQSKDAGTSEHVKEKYRKACSKAKGESVSQRVHQKKTGGGPPKAPLDAVSQKILDLHEDSPNFTGFVGGVEVGGLIITGKHYSQLDV